MKVTPIIAPAADWEGFIREAHGATGRSPVASLVLAGLKAGRLRALPASLGEYQRAGTAAIPFLKGRDCDVVLGHLHVTFLVEAPREALARLLVLGKLNVLAPDDCETSALLTGSLRDWRDVVLSEARLATPPAVREIVTAIHQALVGAGLGDLFALASARSLGDGTLILEPKPGAPRS